MCHTLLAKVYGLSNNFFGGSCLNGHRPNNFKLLYPTNHHIPLGHRIEGERSFNLHKIIGRALFGGHYGCKTPLEMKALLGESGNILIFSIW